jgi:hypothetical protein
MTPMDGVLDDGSDKAGAREEPTLSEGCISTALMLPKTGVGVENPNPEEPPPSDGVAGSNKTGAVRWKAQRLPTKKSPTP